MRLPRALEGNQPPGKYLPVKRQDPGTTLSDPTIEKWDGIKFSWEIGFQSLVAAQVVAGRVPASRPVAPLPPPSLPLLPSPPLTSQSPSSPLMHKSTSPRFPPD